MIAVKRIYEKPATSDGYRVLVDRLWPRGIKKTDAHIDEWLKDIAPSTALRKWFGHDPDRWVEFAARYKKELGSEAAKAQLGRLRGLARGQTVTLLYGARDEQHNDAVVLAAILKGRTASH